MKKNNKKKGFTLVELVVVIAILGILAVIAVPRLSGFQNEAKISADKATYETINRSIAAYVADEKITDDVTVTTDTSGVISFAGLPTDVVILQGTAMLKVDNNKNKSFLWDVTSGVVTPPAIDSTTGVWTGETPTK